MGPLRYLAEPSDERVPCILEADKSSKEYRKNWARLIQKIGACPRLGRGRSIPLTCPVE
ncbi:MAG: hypothetical protein KKH04_12820 [Proteobacteria bacterium]|nr:hypothetical protein [Pseudomonadota bacterium]